MAVEQYQLTRRQVDNILLPPVGSGPNSKTAMNAYWTAAKGVCSGEESDRLEYHRLLKQLYTTLPYNADSAICYPAIFTGNAELVFKSLGQRFTAANILGLMTLWADIDPIRQIWQHPQFPAFARESGLVSA